MMYHFLKNMTSKTTLYTYLTYFPFWGFDVLFFRQNKMFYKIQSFFLEQTLLQEISASKKGKGPQHYENKRIWNF